MKILYDHQIFFEFHGGISRYFIELIRGLRRDESVRVSLSLLYSVNKTITPEEQPVLNRLVAPFERWDFRGQTRARNLLLRTNIPWSKWVLERQRYDVFHPTYYDLYFLKHLDRKPYVVTIMDMIYELYPNWYGDNRATKEAKRVMAEKASKIIAISEHTKKDIIKCYGISDAKIEVIHLGNSFHNLQAGLIPPSCPSKYILFVGKRSTYKNFLLLLQAVASLLKDDQELHLVCIGPDMFSIEEVALMERLGIRQKVVLYLADDRTLSSFYRQAECFVFPSLYEGFGFPILEAFSCGCPVILSNTSSFPEVAGCAAEFFDPKDESSMRYHIGRVVYDDSLKKELREKGYEQVKKYSWEQAVTMTKRVYESVV